MELAVRSVRRDDEMALFALVSQFPTPTPCPQEAFTALLDAKLQDPNACVIVAEQGDTLIGYVSGSARSAFYIGGMTAWVDEILVVPDSRHRGIGGKLMEGFEAWARRRTCKSVALATRGAAAFYEHLGYSTTAGYFKKYLE